MMALFERMEQQKHTQFMAQSSSSSSSSSSAWQQILNSRCVASPLRNVAAAIIGPPGSGKKVIMNSLMASNSFSAASPAAPLIYGHAPVAAAAGNEANMEAFVLGSSTHLLPVVLGQGACRSAADWVVVVCVDVTLEAACVEQCQKLLDEVAQCCSAKRAEAEFKPAIVIFACKGDLLDVDDARWDVTSANLRLLALNYGAAFAVHSSPSPSPTSRQIILGALQLASWPSPCLVRTSFFVPPNHDSAASLRAILEVLGNSTSFLSNNSSKPLENVPLKEVQPVQAEDDQEFIATQVPVAGLDSAELRKKFGAMVSSAFHSDSLAASGGSSSVSALPSSKSGPVSKARADENVAEAFFANLLLGSKKT